MGRARDWCKHYNGAINATCKAGVTYTEVQLGFGTPQLSLPCFKDRNPLGATCDKCSFRTPEEVAALEAEQRKQFERIGTARAAIVAALGGPWKKGTAGAMGSLDCPVCGTVAGLHFSRAGYNGHIHARCETTGCVSWME